MILQIRRTLKWVAAAAAVAAAVIAGVMSMPRTATVEIINEGTTPDEATFEPGVVTVKPGTTVMWNNADASAHTVTSREPGVFDSGVMGPGEEYGFTFGETGEFVYYCKIHPAMVGTVAVQ
jgi:plastocyanin